MGRVVRIIAGAALIAASFFVPAGGLFGVSLLSGAAVGGLGASLAIGGAISFLQPGIRTPRSGALDNPNGRTVNVRQAAAPTRVIYGQQLVGGVLTFAKLGSVSNDYIRLVFTLCNHTIHAIDGVYFDGKLVTDGSVDFIFPYDTKAHIQINYGYDDQEALSDLITDEPEAWTSSHRQRGHAHVYTWLKFDPEVYPTGVPLINFLVRGKQVYDPRNTTAIDSGSDTTPIVITATGHGLVTDDLIRVAGTGTTADGEYFVTKLTDDTFELNGSTAAGAFSDGTFGKYEYSKNAALIANDYLTNQRFGLKVPYSRIDEDALIAAANICDETPTITDFSTSPAGTTTESRYEISGMFDTSERPVDVLQRMAQAMAGHIVYVSGKWVILPGSYRAPDVTLDEGDLIAAPSFDLRRSRRELPNGVKGTFVSPDRAWKETDFPAVSDASALSDDSDERVWLDIALPFTTSASMAQRIAWLVLQRARRQITGTITTMLQGYEVQPGNTLGLTLSHLGWSAKEFEVAETSLTELQSAGGGEAPAIGVIHKLRENDAGIYDDFEDYQEVPGEDVPENQRTEFEPGGYEDAAIIGGMTQAAVGGVGSDRTPMVASAANPPVGLTEPAQVMVAGYAFGHAISRQATETSLFSASVGIGLGGTRSAAGIVHHWELGILNDGSTGYKVFKSNPGNAQFLEPQRFERGNTIRGSSRRNGAIIEAVPYPHWSCCYKGDEGEIPWWCSSGGLSPGITRFHSICGGFYESVEARAQTPMFACTLKRAQLRLRSAQGGGGNQVITLRKNGVATAYTWTVAAGASDESLYPEIESDVVLDTGDLLSVEVVNNDGVSTSASAVISMAFAPVVLHSCPMGFRVRDQGFSTAVYYAPWVAYVGAGNQTEANMRFPLPRGFSLDGSDCLVQLETAVASGTLDVIVRQNGADSGVSRQFTTADTAGVYTLSGSDEFERGDDIDIKIQSSAGSAGFISDITIFGRKRF